MVRPRAEDPTPQNPDSGPREAVDYVCCFSSNRKLVTVFKLVLLGHRPQTSAPRTRLVLRHCILGNWILVFISCTRELLSDLLCHAVAVSEETKPCYLQAFFPGMLPQEPTAKLSSCSAAPSCCAPSACGTTLVTSQ